MPQEVTHYRQDVIRAFEKFYSGLKNPKEDFAEIFPGKVLTWHKIYTEIKIKSQIGKEYYKNLETIYDEFPEQFSFHEN